MLWLISLAREYRNRSFLSTLVQDGVSSRVSRAPLYRIIPFDRPWNLHNHTYIKPCKHGTSSYLLNSMDSSSYVRVCTPPPGLTPSLFAARDLMDALLFRL